MSLIKANAVQIGQSPTATQNFTLAVPSSPDGTIKLARGNAGATTQDVMNVSNAGVVSFPQGLGNISNSTAIATGSTTARSLANRFADVVNVKDFGAVGDGVTDDTAAIQNAINYISSVGGGIVSLPKGTYKISSAISILNSSISFIGDGSGATIINNTSVGDGIVLGNGSTDITGCTVGGFMVQGTPSSGRCIWGRLFTDSCTLFDIYTNSGSKGISLDSCYSLRVNNCRVRSAVGNGIEANSVSHNTVFNECKSQVNGGHGYYTTGCFALEFTGCNSEFNSMDQIHIASGRGIKIDSAYIEGIMPTSSGYAGIQVAAADTVTIIGGLLDATQTGVNGTNGTGTYLKVSGASSRIRMRDYGFVSISGTQTHVNFGASAANCEAVVPLGASYANSSSSCRIYNNDNDERGVIVFNTAVQIFTNLTWNGLYIDTELYDPKGEWSFNRFTPRDYGVYAWNVFVGVNGLTSGSSYAVRLYNITDSFEIAKKQFYATASTINPIDNIFFEEFLEAGKEYQVQLYLSDSANRNSINGSATSRQSIKRIK